MNSQQELLNAINTINQNQDRSFDTPATVLRVDGETVWVHIDGGADETPVSKTINCSEGETVQVRISNGSAFLVGNASAPPTDDTTANEAHFVAEKADIKASKAIRSVEAISQTVEGKVDSGDSNITDLSSTMYQNEYGVNIYNDTLAVGDSYAHIDGDSFDIKQATTAGTIDDANDTVIASFGQEVTVGTRAANSTVGDYSQVFGIDCIASDDYAHAEGFESQATGAYSHAEGCSVASGDYSHAEGYSSVSGDYGHSEGYSQSSGYGAHSEGTATANGRLSHAEGEATLAKGRGSHAQNYWTIANQNQTAIGELNIEDTNNLYVFIIGNGYESGGVKTRRNALCVDWNGNVLIAGTVKDLSGNRLFVAEPASEGTSGQVLTTDGNGGRSWTSAGGGGGVSVSVVGETLVFS